MMVDGPNPVPPELADLVKRVETMPGRWRRELLPLCDRLAAMTRRTDRLVAAAQEAVGDLQLDIRYLHFDLEATRRERDDLRQKLGRE